MIRRILLAGLALATLTRAAELPAPTPITFGQRITIHSNLLNEDRTLLIHVPDDYESAKASYPTLPVLYLLDGEVMYFHVAALVDRLAKTGNIPPMIVVAIVNTDRTRDYTPTHSEIGPQGEQMDGNETSGGSAQFISFLQDELIPWVDTHYHTAPFRILSGHSFGGLVVVRALLENPETFQAYLAASPSLWWGQQVLLQSKGPIGRAGQIMHVGVGAEGSQQRESIERFVGQLRERAAPGFDWTFKAYDEPHSAMVHPSVYDGLKFIFPGFDIVRRPIDAEPATYTEVVRHYEALSRKYGYPMPPPLSVLNLAALYFSFRQHWDEAIAVEREAALRYPQAASPYELIATCYLKKGDTASAVQALEKILELNPRNEEARTQLAQLRSAPPAAR